METFDRLVQIMHKLRAPGGCPWDAEQTHDSIKPALLEETYETLEAIDSKDYKALKEELGDLLLQVIFHSEIGQEKGEFSLEDVIKGITEKLVRRHPHVFGELVPGEEGVSIDKLKAPPSYPGTIHTKDVLHQWSRLKKKEGRKSILEGVPKQLPALQQAHRLSEKAARVGFDWETIEHVWEKFDEEICELKEVLPTADHERLEEELGDVLIVIVNLARKLNIDAESALRKSSAKFVQRFQYIEETFRKRGEDIHDASLKEMEALWDEAKRVLGDNPLSAQ